MENFSISQKIELGYRYVQDLIKRASENNENVRIISDNYRHRETMDEYFSAENLSKTVYGFIADASGYNNLPNFVNNKEFEETEAITLYHGFKKPEYASEMLNDYVYHYGNGLSNDGMLVNGFYLTHRLALADTYTNYGEDNVNRANVLKFKLKPSKFIKMSEIKSLLVNECEGISLEFLQNFDVLKNELLRLKEFSENSRIYKFYEKAILSNLSTIAVLLGADAIIEDEKTYGKENNEQIICLNRGKLIVSESDKQKINNIINEK